MSKGGNNTAVWVGVGCFCCVGIPALLLAGGAGGYFLATTQRDAEEALRRAIEETAELESVEAEPDHHDEEEEEVLIAKSTPTRPPISTPEPIVENTPTPTPAPVVALKPTPIKTATPVKRVATPTPVVTKVVVATPKPTAVASASDSFGERRTIKTSSGTREVTLGKKVALQGSDKKTLIGVLGKARMIAESAILDASEL